MGRAGLARGLGSLPTPATAPIPGSAGVVQLGDDEAVALRPVGDLDGVAEDLVLGEMRCRELRLEAQLGRVEGQDPAIRRSEQLEAVHLSEGRRVDAVDDADLLLERRLAGDRRQRHGGQPERCQARRREAEALPHAKGTKTATSRMMSAKSAVRYVMENL